MNKFFSRNATVERLSDTKDASGDYTGYDTITTGLPCAIFFSASSEQVPKDIHASVTGKKLYSFPFDGDRIKQGDRVTVDGVQYTVIGQPYAAYRGSVLHHYKTAIQEIGDA